MHGPGAVLPQYDLSSDTADLQPIRAPTLLNGAYQQLKLWNGSLGGVGDNLATSGRWTPGTPLESNELGLHGLETQAHAGLKVHRMEHIENSRVAELPEYQAMFALAYPGDADPVSRYNAALAIAAYERTVLTNRAPFQQWLRGNAAALTDQQKRGAIVFFGDGGCVGCHTGPALTSMTFHALGMNDMDRAHDLTTVDLRSFGGTVPDAVRRGRGGFTGVAADDYGFKTPQLYNLQSTSFYGHGSSFPSVRAVIEYKNAGTPENDLVPASRLSPRFRPLGLTNDQLDDLDRFLVQGLFDNEILRYLPDALPSGNCFPVNDPAARADLGCDAAQPAPRFLVWR